MTDSATHHVGLTVTDIEAAIGFYRDVAGMRVTHRNDGVGGPWFDALTGCRAGRLKLAHLALEGLTLQLVQYTSGGEDVLPVAHRRPGTPHFSFRAGDLEARRALAEGRDGCRVSSIERLPSGKRSFYAWDPDGVPVEFIEA